MARGAKVKRLREAKLWKQEQLVQVVSRGGGPLRSISTVSKLEKGGADRAPVNVLEAIADALEVPREALLTQSLDLEIEQDPIAFVSRHSLEAFVRQTRLPPDQAEVFRSTYKRLRVGHRDVSGWTITAGYAKAL